MTYLIAELGINHNGDAEILHEMIDAAAFAKVDAIKFQLGNPADYVNDAKQHELRDTPWGRLTYVEYRQRLELTDDQLKNATAYARSRKLGVVASALDVLTVVRCEELGLELDAYKVASPKLTDEGLLVTMRAVGRPVLLSTGMSTMDEVDRAVHELTRPPHVVPQVTVMHCVSAYPCPDHLLNLDLIPVLKARYPQCHIGYSGHESGVPTTHYAVALGATVIERHLTLDRAMWGSDQAASLEPDGMRSLVNGIRAGERARGTGVKTVDERELINMAKFRTPPNVIPKVLVGRG